MKTLTRHPEPAPAPPVEIEPVAPESVDPVAIVNGEPEAEARACTTCAAPMAGGQDWCLECGTAAAGRLGRRPGWRAVGTTLALTVVLVGSAGAASYAALTSDATRGAAGAPPPDGTPVAQVPPVVAAPPAPVIAAPVAPPKSAAPPSTPAVKLPAAPKVSTPPPAVSVPKAATPAPAPQTPAKPKPKPKPTTGTTAGPRGAGSSGGGKPASKPLVPLVLDGAAVSLYDPYKRAVEPGDPAAASDGDAATTFAVSAPADGKQMQVGLVVDLGTAKRVRGLKVTLSTPGVGLEVYGADGSTLPPAITDTRWDHPASLAAAGTSEQIAFPKDGSAYRYVTLWFTKAPTGGPKAVVKELEVLH